jgi:hypothetical protein
MAEDAGDVVDGKGGEVERFAPLLEEGPGMGLGMNVAVRSIRAARFLAKYLIFCDASPMEHGVSGMTSSSTWPVSPPSWW